MRFQSRAYSHQVQLVFDWYAQENDRLEEFGNIPEENSFLNINQIDQSYQVHIDWQSPQDVFRQ